MHFFVGWFCDSCTTCPASCSPVASPSPAFPLSSSGRRCAGAGRRPPSPAACGTRVRRASGWPPSSTRSSTADRWRWRRRTAQTCRRSEFPGTRRTAGRPARMASLPPAGKEIWLMIHTLLHGVFRFFELLGKYLSELMCKWARKDYVQFWK